MDVILSEKLRAKFGIPRDVGCFVQSVGRSNCLLSDNCTVVFYFILLDEVPEILKALEAAGRRRTLFVWIRFSTERRKTLELSMENVWKWKCSVQLFDYFGQFIFSDLFYFIFHLWVPCLFQNLWKRLKESGRKTIELFITSVLDKNVDIASQIRPIYSAYLKSYFEDVAFFVCQIESLYHQIKQSLNIF